MANKRRKRAKKKQQEEEKKPNKPSFFINVSISLVTAFILYVLYLTVPGYNHLVRVYIIRNSEFILNNFNVSLDRKYQAKLKNDYVFVQFVKNYTPDTAIILMPPPEVFDKSSLNRSGSWGVRSKIWSSYFLYPRILVKEDERDTYPELYSSVTHVMIVNKWGYDKLNYQTSTRMKYGVLPVHKSGIKK